MLFHHLLVAFAIASITPVYADHDCFLCHCCRGNIAGSVNAGKVYYDTYTSLYKANMALLQKMDEENMEGLPFEVVMDDE